MNLPDGFLLYLTSGDGVDITTKGRPRDRKLSLLRRCAATVGFVPIESVDGRRQPLARVEAACDVLRGIDILPVRYTFPSLIGDLVESRLHYEKCRRVTKAPGHFDFEPHVRKVAGKRVVRHWTERELAPLLACDPDATITTTRDELPHLGNHGRHLLLQLEAQTSLDTLAQALLLAPDATIVTGFFDTEGNPRTLAEVVEDFRRSLPQARRVRRHAGWALAAMSMAEADAARDFVLSWDQPETTSSSVPRAS